MSFYFIYFFFKDDVYIVDQGEKDHGLRKSGWSDNSKFSVFLPVSGGRGRDKGKGLTQPP